MSKPQEPSRRRDTTKWIATASLVVNLARLLIELVKH